MRTGRQRTRWLVTLDVNGAPAADLTAQETRVSGGYNEIAAGLLLGRVPTRVQVDIDDVAAGTTRLGCL